MQNDNNNDNNNLIKVCVNHFLSSSFSFSCSNIFLMLIDILKARLRTASTSQEFHRAVKIVMDSDEAFLRNPEIRDIVLSKLHLLFPAQMNDNEFALRAFFNFFSSFFAAASQILATEKFRDIIIYLSKFVTPETVVAFADVITVAAATEEGEKLFALSPDILTMFTDTIFPICRESVHIESLVCAMYNISFSREGKALFGSPRAVEFLIEKVVPSCTSPQSVEYCTGILTKISVPQEQRHSIASYPSIVQAFEEHLCKNVKTAEGALWLTSSINNLSYQCVEGARRFGSSPKIVNAFVDVLFPLCVSDNTTKFWCLNAMTNLTSCEEGRLAFATQNVMDMLTTHLFDESRDLAMSATAAIFAIIMNIVGVKAKKLSDCKLISVEMENAIVSLGPFFNEALMETKRKVDVIHPAAFFKSIQMMSLNSKLLFPTKENRDEFVAALSIPPIFALIEDDVEAKNYHENSLRLINNQ